MISVWKGGSNALLIIPTARKIKIKTEKYCLYWLYGGGAFIYIGFKLFVLGKKFGKRIGSKIQ